MNDIEHLIYPEHCAQGKLAIGVRSVELNANCAVRISIPEEIKEKILMTLRKAEQDMVHACKTNKLVKESLCNPCVIENYECKKCGEFYR